MSKCTFADVPFLIPTEETDKFLDSSLPLTQCRIVTDIPYNAPSTMLGLTYPRQYPETLDLKLNEFSYPTGAVRWGMFNGLVDQDGYEKIIKACYPEGSFPIPQSFIIEQQVSGVTNTVTTDMWCLPPRKVATGLWLITLVDERYMFQYRSIGSNKVTSAGSENYSNQIFCPYVGNTNVDTWDEIIDRISSQVGIEVFYDPVESVYGLPNRYTALNSNNSNIGALLDAIAFNTGRMFVRNLDGTFALQKFSQLTSTSGSLLAGGDFVTRALGTPTVYSPTCERLTCSGVYVVGEAKLTQVDETLVWTNGEYTLTYLDPMIYNPCVWMLEQASTGYIWYVDPWTGVGMTTFSPISGSAPSDITVRCLSTGVLNNLPANVVIPNKIVVQFPRYVNCEIGTGVTFGGNSITNLEHGIIQGVEYFDPESGYVNQNKFNSPSGLTQGDVYQVEVDFNTLFPNGPYLGFEGEKVFSDSCFAWVHDALAYVPYNPINIVELEDLAEQIALDYWQWICLQGKDETFPGILNWVPEGADDLVWVWNGETTFTRVQRKPFNFMWDELCHYIPQPFVCSQWIRCPYAMPRVWNVHLSGGNANWQLSGTVPLTYIGNGQWMNYNMTTDKFIWFNQANEFCDYSDLWIAEYDETAQLIGAEAFWRISASGFGCCSGTTSLEARGNSGYVPAPTIYSMTPGSPCDATQPFGSCEGNNCFPVRSPFYAQLTSSDFLGRWKFKRLTLNTDAQPTYYCQETAKYCAVPLNYVTQTENSQPYAGQIVWMEPIDNLTFGTGWYQFNPSDNRQRHTTANGAIGGGGPTNYNVQGSDTSIANDNAWHDISDGHSSSIQVTLPVAGNYMVWGQANGVISATAASGGSNFYALSIRGYNVNTSTALDCSNVTVASLSVPVNSGTLSAFGSGHFMSPIVVTASTVIKLQAAAYVAAVGGTITNMSITYAPWSSGPTTNSGTSIHFLELSNVYLPPQS